MKIVFISLVILISYLAAPIDSLADGLIPIKNSISEEKRNEIRNSIKNSTSITGRISYGLRAFVGQFPYIARLDIQDANGNIKNCGGTLISYAFTLTAAHCLKNVYAIDSLHGFINDEDHQAHWIRKGIGYAKHPLFKETSFEHNIALVQFEVGLYFDNVSAVRMRNSTNLTYEGDIMTAPGYGEDQTGKPTQGLFFTYMVGESNIECGNYITNKNILCARGIGSSRLNAGDSGGPLIYQNGLVGIASHTYRGKSIFTRVDQYLHWILSYAG